MLLFNSFTASVGRLYIQYIHEYLFQYFFDKISSHKKKIAIKKLTYAGVRVRVRVRVKVRMQENSFTISNTRLG